MVIEEIKKELTQEKIKSLIEGVQNFELPEELAGWVEEYSKIGDRKLFIWKWLFKINQIWFHLPIAENEKYPLALVKTLYNMFIVLLDDAAEKQGKDDLVALLLKLIYEKTNDDAFETAFSKLSPEDKDYFVFSKKVWDKINSIIKNFKNYREIKELFIYDTEQFLNAVKYANLVFKTPEIMNSHEYWLYIPHSMQILIDLDFDLMCSNSFIKEELGRNRKTVLCLQEMGRIGNWISTWEREVMEKDFTSLVPAFAFENNLVSLQELKENPELAIEKIKKEEVVDKILATEWEKRYHLLGELANKTKQILPDDIQGKARYLISMHISSTGWK